MLSNLIDEIIAAYRINPRNKIFIDEKILLASAIEESGSQISINQLRMAIAKFISGEMSVDESSIYDGAIYACSTVAKNCFRDFEKDERDDPSCVDYEINWIENKDRSFLAEIRPT